MDSQLITVIIATHERPLLLHRALHSVRMQAGTWVKTIVVSDVRDNATYLVANQLLGDHDLYIERVGNSGPANSRNIGLELANTPFIMFLDDDDSLTQGFFDTLIPHLEAQCSSVYYCDFKVINEHRLTAGTQMIDGFDVTLGVIDADDTAVKNGIPNNCLIYPKSLIDDRRFDDTLILYEDWDFLLNILSANGTNLKYLPIIGPNIHKNDRSLGERRGARNDDKLLEIIIKIYRKWPGKTLPVKQMRQAYLAGAGVNLPVEFF